MRPRGSWICRRANPRRAGAFITVKGEQTDMKDVKVLIGNYGSGKSELALNFAFKAAETGKT